MKYCNCIRIITGQTCLHIATHLLIIIVLIFGWKYRLLIEVISALVGSYIIIFLVTLFIQYSKRFYWLEDYLEEVTNNYYFGAAILTLFLVSLFVHNNILLIFLGLSILVGPPLISLLDNYFIRLCKKNCIKKNNVNKFISFKIGDRKKD